MTSKVSPKKSQKRSLHRIGVWDNRQAGPCMGWCMGWCMGDGVGDVVLRGWGKCSCILLGLVRLDFGVGRGLV